jgi:hypothetical protein
MPWCDDCSRFWTPNSMRPDGSCPNCGRVIATAQAPTKAPWHFKLLLVAIVLYLGYRAWQGIAWVAHHL